MQWIKRYWDQNFAGGAYDAIGRRKGGGGARSAGGMRAAGASAGVRRTAAAGGGKKKCAWRGRINVMDTWVINMYGFFLCFFE